MRSLSPFADNPLPTRVGVSRRWVVEVERGKPRAEIGLFYAAYDEIDIRLESSSEVERHQNRTAGAPDLA
jgi:HTH-type transcriptional regulator/antitoxin HipB